MLKRYQEKMEKISAEKMAFFLDKDPAGLFAAEEKAFDSKIREVCDYIIEKNTTIILLAGPSSSGKTTSSKKLVRQLTERGKKAQRIELDHFYKPRSELPFWKDGSRNYETIEGLDLELFHHMMTELFEKHEAECPTFDFTVGARGKETIHLEYSPDTFLIFEGIHALNPRFFAAMDGHPCTGIYVSLHSDFVSEDGKVLIPARQLRLTRRIIRDRVSRGSEADNTFAMWDKVLKGERLYIQPYRPTANIHINTAHGFEPFLYRHKITEALKNFPADNKYAPDAARLLQMFDAFDFCDGTYLSENSLIREFYR